MTTDDTTDDLIAKLHADAEQLAADGKAGRLWVHGGKETTREEWTDDQIRWAFWRATTRNCQADRESSDDYLIWTAFQQSMDRARHDERERMGKAIAKALTTTLGDEARSLIYYVADAMNLFDD